MSWQEVAIVFGTSRDSVFRAALVYQLDAGAKRLLYVARDRTKASLNGFFDILSDTTIRGIQFACTDMLPAETESQSDEVADSETA